MNESAPVNVEVIKPSTFESAIGTQIAKSEKQELEGYKVGDVVAFKRVNALPFGQVPFFDQLEDNELKLEIVGVSFDDKLIVKLEGIDFFDECTVEELNSSKA